MLSLCHCCYFQTLRDFILSRLLTTPVEDIERSQYLREMAEKEKYNSGLIAKLTSELQIATEKRDNDVCCLIESDFGLGIGLGLARSGVGLGLATAGLD